MAQRGAAAEPRLQHRGPAARRPRARLKCAAWVAFKGQRNRNWLPQDTGAWPMQKMSWRDLTLRKKRSGMTRRADEVNLCYGIGPVDDFKPAMANAAHVLDVYDHDRFRAIENDLKRQGKVGCSGFLETLDKWQDHHVDASKGALSRHFARQCHHMPRTSSTSTCSLTKASPPRWVTGLPFVLVLAPT
jgi:hypothetical protein